MSEKDIVKILNKFKIQIESWDGEEYGALLDRDFKEAARAILRKSKRVNLKEVKLTKYKEAT